MAVIQYNIFKNNLFFISCVLLFIFTNNQCKSENATITANLTTKQPVEKITTISPLSVNLTSTNGTQNTTEIIKSTPEPPQKPPPALGLPCNGTSQCKANFSTCINGTCSCLSNYIASQGNLRCLPVVSKLGDECSEDQQCTSGLSKDVGPTTCLNFKCSCAIGMSMVDNKCQGRIVLNNKCKSDEECPIIKSFCTEEGECSCAIGFVPNSENDACLPVNLKLLKLGGPTPLKQCSQDVQCQDGMGDLAICAVTNTGGECECVPGSHIIKNMCVPFKGLDESCSYDEECIAKDLNSESAPSRICNQNTCQCNVGWTKVGDICTDGASTNKLAGALMSIILAIWVLNGFLQN